MLPRFELVALRVSDLEPDFHGGATPLVRRGKTDPKGRGAVAYPARDTVALVREWLTRSGVAAGALFRSVAKGDRLGAGLHASQVPRIFNVTARRAGLPATFGGSSVRAQRPRRRRAGHGHRRHRTARDTAGGAVEDHGDGEPLS